MNAFHAFTNMTIVNAVAVKLQFFANEPGDLFICCHDGISSHLLSTVKNSRIFDNVFLIETPRLEKTRGKWGKIPKLRTFLFGKTLESYFSFYMEKYVANKSYDKIFLYYLTGNSAYMASYHLKNNPALKVQFIEEGFFDYMRPSGDLTRTWTFLQQNWKERLANKVCERSYREQLRKAVDGTLYLRMPEAVDIVDYSRFTLLQLHAFPQIQNGETFLKKCGTEVLPQDLIRYNKRQFIIIEDSPYEDSKLVEKLKYELMLDLIGNAGKDNCIVKMHVNYSDYYRKHFGKELECSAYIDRGTYFFEALLAQIEDLDNKVIVGSISSVLMNAKSWLDKEPYIIYNYRIYSALEGKALERMEAMVKAIRDRYSDPSKVMTPNTKAELMAMIAKCRRRIHAEKHHLSYDDDEYFETEIDDGWKAELTQTVSDCMEEAANKEGESINE